MCIELVSLFIYYDWQISFTDLSWYFVSWTLDFFLKLPQITINFWQKKLGVFYTCYTLFILRSSFTIICILSSLGDPISQVSSFLRKSLLEIRLSNIWVLENIFQVSLTLDWILGWVWNARLGNIFFLLASSIAFENYKVILITMLHLQLVFLFQDDFFVLNALKCLKVMPLYVSIFIHCSGTSITSLNLENHVFQFEKLAWIFCF